MRGVRTAVVTGGASGIGRALVWELARRGMRVTVADIDGDAAARVAAELGVDAATLDVADAAAVAGLLRGVRDEHGRLDYVFNNAGIAVVGAAAELTLDHWNRTIDVNLRGVVHGVHAAYPIMVEQGHGHIVNTASLAGVVPAPLMLPYTTAKHAVVGLSLALRSEAAPHGVRVTVVCPGFTETPMLDRPNPDLPPTSLSDRTRELAGRIQPRLHPADEVAADVIHGVARNRAMVVTPRSSRMAWRAARLSPSLPAGVAGEALRRVTRLLSR